MWPNEHVRLDSALVFFKTKTSRIIWSSPNPQFLFFWRKKWSEKLGIFWKDHAWQNLSFSRCKDNWNLPSLMIASFKIYFGRHHLQYIVSLAGSTIIDTKLRFSFTYSSTSFNLYDFNCCNKVLWCSIQYIYFWLPCQAYGIMTERVINSVHYMDKINNKKR